MSTKKFCCKVTPYYIMKKEDMFRIWEEMGKYHEYELSVMSWTLTT